MFVHYHPGKPILFPQLATRAQLRPSPLESLKNIVCSVQSLFRAILEGKVPLISFHAVCAKPSPS